MNSNKKLILPVLFIVTLGAGFLGGIYFQKSKAHAASLSALINPDTVDVKSNEFSMFWDVWKILHTDFVGRDKLESQKLIYGAIDGMVSSLEDPYTVFFPPKESEQFQQQIKGAFGGVGIELGMRNEMLTVIAPIKESPAERAGILAGDKIAKIDGKPTDGMRVNEAVDIIRGQPGTAVTLTILREKKEPKDYKLIRDTIKIPAVAWKMLDGDVAYLQVYVFNANVDHEFKKAASEIIHSPAKKIILDLRNNPGGLLDSAVNLAGYFLDENQVVTIERFGDGREKLYKTSANAQLKNYPVVILVNKGSASASEILAGALRDQRKISIVGETSFGKGSVQDVHDLDKGSSLKVTIAKWYTPGGFTIDKTGISPTVGASRSEDEFDKGKDSQLDKALELIKNL